MTDLLSIACSSINVSAITKRLYTRIPYSKLIVSFLQLMERLGYIRGFKILSKRHVLVYLKYFENKPVIRKLIRLSTPGNRFFYRPKSNNKFGNFQGFVAISTSKGLLSDQECTFHNVGGEPVVLIT